MGTKLTAAAALTACVVWNLPERAGAQGAGVVLPRIDVTASRAFGGVTGTARSVITAEDIERSPAQSLPEILSQQVGIQTQNLFGSRSSVDLRGFGAFAASNVLILVNGRRYQDFDLQGFDFASIPLNSIERVEITRGNSGAVIYGDGAVGGVINIVTKRGNALASAGRVEALAGSYSHREARGSAGGAWGPWAISLFGNAMTSGGYRENSDLAQQNINGTLNYTGANWTGYANLALDNQQQNLAGALGNRPSAFVPYWLNTPAQSNTPLDWGDKQGVNFTTGFTAGLADGVELIVDGGIRRKFQQALYYNYSPPPFFAYTVAGAVPMNYVDTVMTTTSFTPRLDIAHRLFGLSNRLLTGIDFYNTEYRSDRSVAQDTPSVHRYDVRQTTGAFYAMNTTTLTPGLELSMGGRLQRNSIRATDDYNAAIDPNAFFYTSNPQAPDLDKDEWQYAAHLGLEYRVNPMLTLFGRAARAFRLGNADERVGAGSAFTFLPANFDLETQTSFDIEGGFRVNGGPFSLASSVYLMRLNNEIHFVPALGVNENLDPTQRIGWETSTQYRLNDKVRVRGGVAYTRATFREGPYAGNDVPLVSPWSGNAGLSWDVVGKLVVLDLNTRFFSGRRMDNDQPNIQPEIPGATIVDVKIGGQYDRFFWSAAVLNLFDKAYFDYAIASGGLPASIFGPATAPTVGVFNAYPLAGRTFMLSAGATF